jgi:putative redox protein
MSFVAETGSGHSFVMDVAPESGGRNVGPRPMETVLAGSGGCTAIDVVLILKRGRHDVRGCDVQLKAERADSDPKVFTKIHFHFVVRGCGLSPSAVERAIQLSHDKYCSATAMLAKTAAITHDYEIVEDS